MLILAMMVGGGWYRRETDLESVMDGAMQANAGVQAGLGAGMN